MKRATDQVGSDTGRLAAADALARALTFDMANWWQPTAANYFARIKKDQILQAIQEVTGAPVKERLRSQIARRKAVALFELPKAGRQSE
jgi:hypothetical protein